MSTPPIRRLVDALRRLRNADPARSLDTSIDARHFAASITGRDEIPLVDGPPGHHRPRGAFLAAATLVVGVSAGAIVLAHSHAGTSTTAWPGPQLPGRALLTRPGVTAPPNGSPGGSRSDSPSGSPGDDPHRGEAQALVAELLAAAPLPSDATPLAGDGPAVLGPSISASPNDLDQHSLWTVPGTMASVLAYVRTHLPTGWIESGSDSSGDRGRTTSMGVMLEVAGTGHLDYASNVDVQIDTAPYRGGAAVRVDAQAIWLPTKPAGAIITEPTSVVVAVERPKHRTLHRTLGATDASALAKAINRMAPDVAGPRSCPADFGGTDVLRFTTPTGALVATQNVTGCPGVAITRGGKTVLDLTGSIDAKLLHLLDLPANYGYPR